MTPYLRERSDRVRCAMCGDMVDPYCPTDHRVADITTMQDRRDAFVVMTCDKPEATPLPRPTTASGLLDELAGVVVRALHNRGENLARRYRIEIDGFRPNGRTVRREYHLESDELAKAWPALRRSCLELEPIPYEREA